MDIINLSKTFLEIGGITVTMYSFCIVTGMVIGTILSILEGKKYGIAKENILDGILYGIPLGIIGARLYYVIFEWNRYYVKGDLWETFKNVIAIYEGGLGITGGIIVGLTFAIVFCKIKKINILKAIDLFAPGMLIAQACGRWGNFFNQEAHGGKIENVELMYKLLPDWIMDNMYFYSKDGINGSGMTTYWHPTFLYESLWNILGVILIFITRRKIKQIQVGDYLGFYLIWYGFGRATLIEPFRTDPLMLGDIRINVFIPLLFVLGGLIYLIVKRIKFPQPSYLEEVCRIELENQLIKDNIEEEIE